MMIDGIETVKLDDAAHAVSLWNGYETVSHGLRTLDDARQLAHAIVTARANGDGFRVDRVSIESRDSAGGWQPAATVTRA